jgi:hypothetical protein
MIAELQVDPSTPTLPSVILIGLTPGDVERLRSSGPISIRLRDLGLHAFQEDPSLTIAMGAEKEPRRLNVSDGMLRWMRETTPVSSTFGELGLPGVGRVVVFHGKTDEATASAVAAYRQRLARSTFVDDTVVTEYRLDRVKGRVSVERKAQRAGGLFSWLFGRS